MQRVKCEIAFAIPKPKGRWPTGDYQWLRDWTAKVDLTLETDDTGGTTPGVSLIDPLPSSQTFTFGLGGGVNTLASRTETMSFTLSFAELRNWDYLNVNRCAEARGLGLLGNLGLGEWMDAALAPTVGGKFAELRIGYHAPPSSGAKATPAPKKGPKVAAETQIDKLNDIMHDVNWYADDAQRNAKSAQKLAAILRNDDLTKPPETFYREVQATADYIAKTQDAIDQTKKQIGLAEAQILVLKPDEDSADVKAAIDKARQGITDANKAITKAAQTVTAAQGALPTNGPIDPIAHQVSFTVTFSGNATPNWSLIRFKGPGTSNNSFLSASRAFIHTLNISMGSPSDGGLGKVSAEQIRQLNNLHQDSALRNALTLRSGVVGAPF